MKSTNRRKIKSNHQGDHVSVFCKEENKKIIDIFQDIASKYNAPYYRSIKTTPKVVGKITKLKSG